MGLTPLMIDLADKEIVIAGGGRVAERRIRSLLESGACITVISPHVTEDIQRFAEEGKIKWKQRNIRHRDIQAVFLLIAATDNPEVNQAIIQSAPSNALVNATGDAELGNTQFPAVLERGKLSIAISTNGASPKLAAKLRNQLANELDQGYEAYVDFLDTFRRLLKQSTLKKSNQNLLLEEILSISHRDHRKQQLALEWIQKLTEEGGGRVKGLEGKTIAIAASRRADALSELIRKTGGTPKSFPIQGELVLHEQKSIESVRTLLNRSFDFIVLTTGIGLEALENAALKTDCFDRFIQKMREEMLVIRGSKTQKWLKKHQLTASFIADEGIMENLLYYLKEQKNEKKQTIFLQSYHQDEQLIQKRLEEYGYEVYISQPYQYKEPDPSILKALKRDIQAKKVNAVVFTTKKQVQNLFTSTDDREELIHLFNHHVLAAAVGKVTAKELRSYGIEQVYYPENQRMGAMVIGLQDL